MGGDVVIQAGAAAARASTPDEHRRSLLAKGGLDFLGVGRAADLRAHVLLVAVTVTQAHVLDDVQSVFAQPQLSLSGQLCARAENSPRPNASSRCPR